MLAERTIINDRYQIIRQVGQGGMGAVYEAYDQRLRSPVALKHMIVAQEQYGRAFEREAHLLANSRHAALPKVIDYFTVEQGSFLVMEFIPGPDLATVLAERKSPFAINDVMRWANTLLDVLDYLHTQTPAIIHRDIKPQNLKLTERNEIILLDFGLAKGPVTRRFNPANMKSVAGWTPQYAPLEQINGTGTDPRSDVYSLGATLYQLLTTQPPMSATARAEEIVANRPDPICPVYQLNPLVPQWISAVIMHALELNASDRFTDAAAMRGALQFDLRVAAEAVTKVTKEVAQQSTIDPRSRTIVDPPIVDTLKTRTNDEPKNFKTTHSVTSRDKSVTPPKRRSPMKWVGAALVLILVAVGGVVGGLMIGNFRGQESGLTGGTAVDGTGGGSGSSTGSNKENEVLLHQAIYKVMGGELVSYAGTKSELKLNVRITWNGSYPANFTADHFRLILDGRALEPVTAPNEVVDSFASKETEVVFEVPKSISKFELQVGRYNEETDKLPLTLDGVTKASEQNKAAAANIPQRRYPITLPSGQEMRVGSGTYKIMSAVLDHFAPGKMSLVYDIALTNNQETQMNFWQYEFRLVVDGAPIAPFEAPNVTVSYQKTAQGKIVFVIPEYIRQVDFKIGKVGEKTETVSYNLVTAK